MSDKVAAVTNLDSYQIDVHKLGCRDLKRTYHEVDTIDGNLESIREWAQTVFGEVEESVNENADPFIRFFPCSVMR